MEYKELTAQLRRIAIKEGFFGGMNMTREEAIEILEYKTTIPDTNYTWAQIGQAIDTAISALRSVSREQVEKVWKGEWLYLSDFDGCTWFECSKCEHALDSKDDLQQFCPNCGAPMTDEAVKITMKRLEALYGLVEV